MIRLLSQLQAAAGSKQRHTASSSSGIKKQRVLLAAGGGGLLKNGPFRNGLKSRRGKGRKGALRQSDVSLEDLISSQFRQPTRPFECVRQSCDLLKCLIYCALMNYSGRSILSCTCPCVLILSSCLVRAGFTPAHAHHPVLFYTLPLFHNYCKLLCFALLAASLRTS
jgi:hypothetical protein